MDVKLKHATGVPINRCETTTVNAFQIHFRLMKSVRFRHHITHSYIPNRLSSHELTDQKSKERKTATPKKADRIPFRKIKEQEVNDGYCKYKYYMELFRYTLFTLYYFTTILDAFFLPFPYLCVAVQSCRCFCYCWFLFFIANACH